MFPPFFCHLPRPLVDRVGGRMISDFRPVCDTLTLSLKEREPSAVHILFPDALPITLITPDNPCQHQACPDRLGSRLGQTREEHQCQIILCWKKTATLPH